MKGNGNDGSGDNQERDLWQTEQGFWDRLNEQYNFAFDIEDDCILWKQGDKVKYCNGWHWTHHDDKEKIVMPDGRELFSIFSKLEA